MPRVPLCPPASSFQLQPHFRHKKAMVTLKMSFAVHPSVKDGGAELLVHQHIVKNMTSTRGFSRMEPGVLVTWPVLKDGVGNHQPIQSAEVQQAHTILILLCRSKPTNDTLPGCSIIPHPGIKVPQDQQHVTPWNLPHTHSCSD